MNCELKSHSVEEAGVPLDVFDGDVLAVAYVGEGEDHGGADEGALEILDDGSATCDDDLGEVVVDGDALAVDIGGAAAMDDEGGEGGDVEEPLLARDEVVAVAATDADIVHA